MKAKLYDRIVTVVDINAKFSKRFIPKGTVGTVAECYQRPEETYAVDLKIVDEGAFGGFDYENVVLSPEQFKVVNNTPEEEHLKSVYKDIHYEVPNITPDDAEFPPKPNESPNQSQVNS